MTETTTTETAELVVERWTYLGRRLDAKNVLRQSWLFPDGESYTLQKPLVRYAAVGQVWAVTRSPRGGWYTAGEHAPKRLAGVVELDDRQRAAYAAEDQLAADRYNALNLDRAAAKKDSPLDQEVDRLKDLTRWMTPAQRRAFVGQLIQELL